MNYSNISAAPRSLSLSQQKARLLPWKLVQQTIDSAIRARYLIIEANGVNWPCDLAKANVVRLRFNDATTSPKTSRELGIENDVNVLVARADLDSNQLQDLSDSLSDLLRIKAKANVPLDFNVEIRFGDRGKRPEQAVIEEVNAILTKVSERFKLE